MLWEQDYQLWESQDSEVSPEPVFIDLKALWFIASYWAVDGAALRAVDLGNAKVSAQRQCMWRSLHKRC